ncbi:MAG: LiaF transmembrane domain-containing protein [Merdibacter sp.]
MKKERIFWGLFFLLAAVLVILNRFSLFAEISLIRLLVTIALVIWLLQSIIHRSMTGILFSIAFLLICYDDLLPLEPLTPGTLLLAATFASIGFHFLIPHRSGSFDDQRSARLGRCRPGIGQRQLCPPEDDHGHRHQICELRRLSAGRYRMLHGGDESVF